VDWISKYVVVWQSRIALGLAFFGAMLVVLWSDHARDIDAAKLITCILTGAAWLVAELTSAVPKVSKHGRELFARIITIMDDNALTFLMQHEFAVRWRARDLYRILQ
jgi:hypothetical protein